jgi:RNA polymerase sigma-70 factor, ECF subfamily
VVEPATIALGKGRPAVSEASRDPAAVSRPTSDDEEFTAFFMTDFGPLTAYCARLLPRETAEETAQESLVRVWTHWPTVRDPHAYAFLVATNLVRRQWRSASKQRSVREKLGPDERTRVELRDQVVELRDLVDRLPARLRTPTLLHYYADFSTAEVARLLRRPPGTIRRRLGEARRLLGDALKETE